MSEWFKDRRQEFIAATLRQFGQVRRTDLCREFGITVAVASADIAAFLAGEPPNVKYDVSAKAYVLTDGPAPMPETEVAQVTQADREAAADLIEAYWQGAGERHDQMRKLAQSYRDGHTQGVWAEAFARHRRAALGSAKESGE